MATTNAIIIDTGDLDPATVAAIHDAVAVIIAEASGMEPAANAVRGWTPELVREFDKRLRERGRSDRADVIRASARSGGRIDRSTVVTICQLEPDRKINGFTKPVKGVLNQMITEGLLPADVANPLHPLYPSGAIGQAIGFDMPSEVAAVFIAAFNED